MLTRVLLSISVVYTCFAGAALAQSQHLQSTLVVNGQSGTADFYRVGGKSYVDLEALVRIGNGAISTQGTTIVLTLPGPLQTMAPEGSTQNEQDDPALSSDFMTASVDSLGAIKEWIGSLAYAARRGVPGDGSRITVLQNRATQALLVAKARAKQKSDQRALQLLTNNHNTLNGWSDKLIRERRSMDTGKYSMSPDLIDRDETYQKIVACTTFLGTMVPSGQFQDDPSCH